MNDAALGELRTLRLWHWKQVRSNRAVADAYALHELTTDTTQHERIHHQVANFHLSAVQALNSCFPVGDTAERDDAG